jgi:hypothetical protein
MGTLEFWQELRDKFTFAAHHPKRQYRFVRATRCNAYAKRYTTENNTQKFDQNFNH